MEVEIINYEAQNTRNKTKIILLHPGVIECVDLWTPGDLRGRRFARDDDDARHRLGPRRTTKTLRHRCLGYRYIRDYEVKLLFELNGSISDGNKCLISVHMVLMNNKIK